MKTKTLCLPKKIDYHQKGRFHSSNKPIENYRKSGFVFPNQLSILWKCLHFGTFVGNK